ncbi:MAG: hypothetical protein Q7R33_01635 [Nitrosarchaeum sp.]|nr:hypothetical protein [Nitrosarchaeum sp.]
MNFLLTLLKIFKKPTKPIEQPVEPIKSVETIIEPINLPKDEYMLNTSKLKGIVPDALLPQIDAAAPKFNITTNLRLCHFLAQCEHESGGFKLVKENLNYSVDGLLKIFPKYFNTTTAPLYAKQPAKIANKVYASRMGNGDEASGDGFKFSGKGYIQLTGKTNYQKFSTFIGEDCVVTPDLVATKYPLASAAFFFNSNGLWPICDKGSDDATVTLVTKRVNGGTIGLDDRLKNFKKYFSILGA